MIENMISDMKLKVVGLWLFLGHSIALFAALFQTWFSLGDNSFSLLATNSISTLDFVNPSCTTIYQLHQGYQCHCDNCGELVALYKAGQILFTCILLSSICLMVQLSNIQRKIWRLESMPPEESLIDNDRLHSFGVSFISCGLLIWLYQISSYEYLFTNIKLKTGCINVFIGLGIITWGNLYFVYSAKPAYESELNNRINRL